MRRPSSEGLPVESAKPLNRRGELRYLLGKAEDSDSPVVDNDEVVFLVAHVSSYSDSVWRAPRGCIAVEVEDGRVISANNIAQRMSKPFVPPSPTSEQHQRPIRRRDPRLALQLRVLQLCRRPSLEARAMFRASLHPEL